MNEYETPEYKEEQKVLAVMSNDFLRGMRFCIADTARDSNFWDTHLFAYTSQDIIQSCFSILMLSCDGVTNPCRRESRFLLELAIKQCFIEQQMPGAKVEEKLRSYKELLNSSNISVKSKIVLGLLPEPLQAKFHEDVGRFYGASSNYVHLSLQQVQERIDLVQRGVTVGSEGTRELIEMIEWLRTCYSLVLILLFHCLPRYVVGDLLVEPDGSLNGWYFGQSQYIAAVDEQFDYKHERQASLEQLRQDRQKRVKF